MNCSEAKKISIVGYLASIGKQPESVKNNSVWYCSPFRQESKASFKVDRQSNIWYDFGSGSGGNVLDLVMQINNTGLTGALLILQKPELSKHTFSFFEQQNSYSENIEIKHVQHLQNRALIQYLVSREVTQDKARNYVQEAYYQVKGKQYFSLAFKNDRGGFELRNKYFKGSSSPKEITTIPGSKEVLNISEGFFDFLSALEFYEVKKPTGTCIVLNSLSNLDSILNKITDYQKINLYLDNDNPGIQAANKIKEIHSRVSDYSKIIYAGKKDMNEFWVQFKKHPAKTECY